MRRLIWVFIGIVFWPGTAFANVPPAPQVILAELAIIPMVLLLYVLSGAAAYYDKKSPKGVGSRRGRAVGFTIFALFMSIGMASMAVLSATVMAIYAVILGIKMLGVKTDPDLYLGVWVPRIAGTVLIPMAVLLAGFSFALGPIHYFQDHISLKGNLRRFSDFQTAYALGHDGKNMEIPIKGPDYCSYLDWDKEDVEDLDLYNACGAMGLQMSKRWYGHARDFSIVYSPDLKNYEIRVTPVLFPFWPYNYLAPRRAFYMDQTGVIRSIEMFDPGDGASSTSPPF